MSIAYFVIAPAVVVKDSVGKLRYLYKDAPLPDGLGEEEIGRHLAAGRIAALELPDPVVPDGIVTLHLPDLGDDPAAQLTEMGLPFTRNDDGSFTVTGPAAEPAPAPTGAGQQPPDGETFDEPPLDPPPADLVDPVDPPADLADPPVDEGTPAAGSAKRGRRS